MVIVGLILLVLGLVLGIGILWLLGLVLVAVGAILFLSGSPQRSLRRRRHYW
jgi:hypothetical protein